MVNRKGGRTPSIFSSGFPGIVWSCLPSDWTGVQVTAWARKAHKADIVLDVSVVQIGSTRRRELAVRGGGHGLHDRGGLG
jgi:hypothetical protein